MQQIWLIPVFRFGNGYTVILHIAGHPTDEHKIHVMDFISKTFPSAQLKEHHQNMLQYQLGSTLLSLAYIFGELEKARDWLHIEDYSVCQTTLDQVSLENFTLVLSCFFPSCGVVDGQAVERVELCTQLLAVQNVGSLICPILPMCFFLRGSKKCWFLLSGVDDGM